jgi:hypothetical protein
MDDDLWGDDALPPPLDSEDELEPEPEPEPEAPEIAEATASCASDGDVEACLRVLSALTNEKEVFLNSRRFRAVRAQVMTLSKVMNEKMYDGKSAGEPTAPPCIPLPPKPIRLWLRDLSNLVKRVADSRGWFGRMGAAEYIEWSVKANIERAARDRLRRRDADKVEKTQLRAARLQRLAELQEQQSAHGMLALSAVPDGAVETAGGGGAGAAMLAAGVGAQNSFGRRQPGGRRRAAASGTALLSVQELVPEVASFLCPTLPCVRGPELGEAPPDRRYER